MSLPRRRLLGCSFSSARSHSRAFALLLALCLFAPPAFSEIRYWVDDSGVTHFSDDPEAGPVDATDLDSNGYETLRSAWDDGLEGPGFVTVSRVSAGIVSIDLCAAPLRI